MLLTAKIFKTAHKGFVLLSLKPNYHVIHTSQTRIKNYRINKMLWNNYNSLPTSFC